LEIAGTRESQERKKHSYAAKEALQGEICAFWFTSNQNRLIRVNNMPARIILSAMLRVPVGLSGGSGHPAIKAPLKTAYK
jgi:hypothetical protein